MTLVVSLGEHNQECGQRGLGRSQGTRTFRGTARRCSYQSSVKETHGSVTDTSSQREPQRNSEETEAGPTHQGSHHSFTKRYKGRLLMELLRELNGELFD